MRSFMSVALLLALTSPACAQSGAGTRVHVLLEPMNVDYDGNVARITYRVTNQAESAENLFTITVDAPTGVQEIWAPGDPEVWSLAKAYRGKSVAEWAALSTQLAPGKVVEGIGNSAVGVFGWVDAWMGGYVPPPTLAEDTARNSDSADSDPLLSRTAKARVIGIVPPPPGGVTGMVDYMHGQLQTVCADDSTLRRGLCRSLEAKLAAARASLDRGAVQATRGQLEAFINEALTPPVSRSLGVGAWLLIGNAKVLLGQLPR